MKKEVIAAFLLIAGFSIGRITYNSGIKDIIPLFLSYNSKSHVEFTLNRIKDKGRLDDISDFVIKEYQTNPHANKEYILRTTELGMKEYPAQTLGLAGGLIAEDLKETIDQYTGGW